MSLTNVFNIAATALAAQSMRLNAVASNLANTDSAHASTGTGYRAKQVVFETMLMNETQPWAKGVRMKEVIEDPNPPRLVYDPKHPLADEQGYIAYPNVDPVEEMVNMISASRSYQTNAEIMSTTKMLMQRTLAIAQE